MNNFIQLVQENKSFCIFPFIELLVQNGYTNVCCRSFEPITRLDKLKDWQTDPAYTEIRNKMLQGERIEKHCSTCYKMEDMGMLSPRQSETVEWANRLGINSVEELKNIRNPVYYEVRPSNLCNLQCRTCGPINSKLIELEYRKLGFPGSERTWEHIDFSFIDMDNIKKLYVAGGEPTVMPELVQFMEDCISKKHTNFEFLINTNAYKISSRMYSLFSQFQKLIFIISIDGYKELNHYIRWPSQWDNIIENARTLKSNGHQICFNVVVSIYNISTLNKLIAFLDKEFPGCKVIGNLAENIPPFLYPEHSQVHENLKTIVDLNCYKADSLFQSFIDGLINYFSKPNNIDSVGLREFFKFNDALDQSRNIQLVDYNKELEQCRQYIV